MAKRYYACVYGGASERIAHKHIEDIERLGKIIAYNDYSLVYGAGASGCMGAVARGVTENDGYVMGISPHFISEFEPIYDCDNTVMVETMSERKMLMEKHADVYFIAPGGVGTMDEFFQVLTLKYLNRISEPIVILNIDGFYDSLIAFIDDLVKKGAVIENIHKLYNVEDKIDQDTLKKYFVKK
ncbi:MAG: TIGR00730 family Rossman fold protein [Ruminococcaceae bacterium]|nr:TIGR00730 family Rossman fold protein [Oscillospiraceae bacterium]